MSPFDPERKCLRQTSRLTVWSGEAKSPRMKGSARSLPLSRIKSFKFLEPSHRVLLPQHRVIDAAGIKGITRLIRVLLEIAEELLDLSLHGYEQPNIARQEIDRTTTFFKPSLIRIHAQIGDQRPSRCLSNPCRDVTSLSQN